jgi:hypothetical protein
VERYDRKSTLTWLLEGLHRNQESSTVAATHNAGPCHCHCLSTAVIMDAPNLWKLDKETWGPAPEKVPECDTLLVSSSCPRRMLLSFLPSLKTCTAAHHLCSDPKLHPELLLHRNLENLILTFWKEGDVNKSWKKLTSTHCTNGLLSKEQNHTSAE